MTKESIFDSTNIKLFCWVVRELKLNAVVALLEFDALVTLLELDALVEVDTFEFD